MKDILFLNHKQKQCGVYQYGYRSATILKNSTKYNFIYCEVETEVEYTIALSKFTPNAIIYNYHPSTMSWLNRYIIQLYPFSTHFGIHHEGNDTHEVGFDYFLMTDSTAKDMLNYFSVPRPLIEGISFIPSYYSTNSTPMIGSFGFGFNNKGFERLVKLVTEQFEYAIIKLHIPFAHYGDIHGESAREIANSCKKQIMSRRFDLQITHDFKTDIEILDFLSCNSINCFLYDEMPGRGLSSVIDYALTVDVPLAISKTTMFRHLINTTPSICVEDRTIKEIMESGTGPLRPYRDKWSNKNFINKYEHILNTTVK